MMTTMIATILLAATAMPTPTGAVRRAPLTVEKCGLVQSALSFEGEYRYPFAYSVSCFKGFVAARGWKAEHVIDLGKGKGRPMGMILSYTNATDRLSAALMPLGPRRTSLQYQVESKTTQVPKSDLSVVPSVQVCKKEKAR